MWDLLDVSESIYFNLIPPLPIFLPHLSPHFITHTLFIYSCTVDTAYEAVQKKTFFVMSICIISFFIVLVGILIIYPKLAAKTKIHKDDIESDEERRAMLGTDGNSTLDSFY